MEYMKINQPNSSVRGDNSTLCSLCMLCRPDIMPANTLSMSLEISVVATVESTELGLDCVIGSLVPVTVVDEAVAVVGELLAPLIGQTGAETAEGAGLLVVLRR